MKITQDVRDYAAKHGVSEQEALKKGMEVKAIEFVKKGARDLPARLTDHAAPPRPWSSTRPPPALQAFEDRARGALRSRAPGAAGRARLAPAPARHAARRSAWRAEAQRLADTTAVAGAALRARLTLTRAECALLQARMEEAEALAERAPRPLPRMRRTTRAWATARCSQARIARGPRRARARAAAVSRGARGLPRVAATPQRLGHARAAALLANSFGDPAAMAAELRRHPRRGRRRIPRAVEAHLRLIDGFIAFQRGAFLEAVPALTAAARGRLRVRAASSRRFRAEAGLVSAYSNLGDREASCALAEQLLNRARALGWPRAIGHALANFGRQLADTGQPERAVELLLEARTVLADQPRSRGFAHRLLLPRRRSTWRSAATTRRWRSSSAPSS